MNDLTKDALYEYDAEKLKVAMYRAGFDPHHPEDYAKRAKVALGTVERILGIRVRGMPKNRARLIKGVTANMLCRPLRLNPHELCPGVPQPMPLPAEKKLPDYAAFTGYNDWRTHADARTRRKTLREVEAEERVMEVSDVT